MPDSGLVKKAQHRLRLRELAKYYCVASSLVGSDEQGNGDSSDRDYFGAAVNFRPQPPRLAEDGILTALGQLAARKLHCRRSLISIVDDQIQYVIAEATPSISFFDKDKHDPDEGLLLGVQPLPLQYGLCPIGLTAFLGINQVTLDNPENEVDVDRLAISDLWSESVTKDVPVVKQYPSHFRYYVEVPLRSDSGYVLGSVCVADAAPRPVGADDVKNLQDIARLIVQHLDWARMKEDHGRAERLIEGLSHFIQGKGSISDWSKATAGQATIPNVHTERVLSPPPQQGSLSRSKPTLNTANPWVEMPPTPATSTSAGDTKAVSQSFSTASIDEETPPTSVPAGSVQPLADVYTGFDPPVESLPETDFQQGVSASIKIRHAFSRASNLIRESMDLDVTCILEVPHNERFRNIGRRRHSRVSNENLTETGAQSNEAGTSSDSSNEIPLPERNVAQDEEKPGDDVMCHRLGFSTRHKSSLAGSNTTALYLTLPAKLLAKLAAKYPDGHIFHFDRFGHSSSDDIHENHTPRSNQQKRETVSHQLSRLLPDARSLAFLPLYDNDKQQLYAAFLGWTDNMARALQPGELNYVSGFTNSVMCEVMRLEAVATDKAKSNFISSISHELRSPLHGILAANQLLSESKMYPQQAEFTHMIDTCARTLLDIMDHLLSHAKINHFVDRQAHEKRRKGVVESREKSKTFSLVTRVDLISVIEETAASLAASSNQLLTQGSQPVRGITPLSDASSAIGKSEDLSPPIIINFRWHKRWMFDTEAGSWRRIILNLLGNSIKYTRSGFISIDLDFQETSAPRSTTNRVVELRITDTGQGISEEYLKHRLYTPFAQENNLSVGTGLGLSLVHQIVSSLKGHVQVLSEVGTGTEVIVRIPLKVSETQFKDSSLADATDAKTLALSVGTSFRTCGFEDQPPISEPPTGVLSPHNKALLMMAESVSSMLIGWFGMKQTSSRDADIHVIEETFLGANLELYDLSSKSLFIIGMEGRGSVRKRICHANYIYVLPPLGPDRLSNGMRMLMQIHKDRLRALAVESPSAPETAVGPLISPDSSHPPKPALQSEDVVTSTPSHPERDAPTTATLAHPTTPSEETSKPLDSQLAPQTVRKKDAILLVDDNDINLRILVATVTRVKGRTVDYVTATNGQKALDRYIETVDSGTRISVVFMDISMPIMDGFKSTREIRAYEKAKGIKKESRAMIVALTGLGSLEAQREIEDCGFDMYLRKPANLQKIRETLLDGTDETDENDETAEAG